MIRRILNLLRREERHKAIKVIFTTFFMALLDFVSLASLLPILYFLLDGDNKDNAILFFSLLAVVVLAVKSALGIIFGRYQQQFLLMLYKRMSLSLYASYYNKGLLFIREQGASRLGYQVNAICFGFSHTLLSPLIKIIGDSLLVILITIALTIYNPVLALILFISFLPIIIIYLCIVRRKVKQYGEQEQEAKRKQSLIVQETYNGYSEILVNDAFPLLKEMFTYGIDRISASRLKLDAIMRTPAFLTEMATLAGLIVIALAHPRSPGIIIATYAVAALRILPAVRHILSGYTQMQNSAVCLDIIEEGMTSQTPQNAPASAEIRFTETITLKEISYTYPNGEEIFNRFNCTIHKGESVGFKGHSGVGKSTLFNIILGFIEPSGGEVLIDNTPLNGTNRDSWLKQIGYVSQEIFIFNATLAQNIALGAVEADINRERISNILKQVGLGEWLSTLPCGIDTVITESGKKLSGGQKQRIAIARALYKNVGLLMLDEATSSLDNNMEREINNILEKLRREVKGLTILTIAHRESTLAYSDRIIDMDYDR